MVGGQTNTERVRMANCWDTLLSAYPDINTSEKTKNACGVRLGLGRTCFALFFLCFQWSVVAKHLYPASALPKIQTHRNIELLFTSSGLYQNLHSWHPTLNLKLGFFFPAPLFLPLLPDLTDDITIFHPVPEPVAEEGCPVFEL